MAVRIADALAGRRVLVTGATGFIGEALLRTLLVEVPGARPVVLVRPKAGQPGAARLARTLRKRTFAPAVEAAGGGAAGTAALLERVQVVEGDLSAVPALPDDLDVVVHCAGEVSFDPPIHEALDVNVVGTRALLARVREVDDAQRRRGRRVHYVHVSTAYVGGRRRGPVPEGPVEHAVDWRTELEAGLAVARDVELASRAPAQLARFNAEAEAVHGPAGPLTSAADAERRRREWVLSQQRAAGGQRGHSLGWTDVYTFTKALGERVVEELVGGDDPLPVTVVRPSIVESALLAPHPGWIEGFKMAEPIILSFGRGELPEVPAAPDATIDVVPVDHVVNAMVAVCATPPAPGPPRYFHVASGARNPLPFRRLYELVREHFEAHPFDPGESGPEVLPTWTFPGAAAVERRLALGERLHAAGERVLGLAPRSDRVRERARDLDRAKGRLELLRRYSDLYQAYTQSELHFVDDATLALHRGLHPDDAATFGFDTAAIDWAHYIRDVHTPAVTAPVRKLDDLRRRRSTAAGRGRELAPAAEGAGPGDVLAVFDLDGTLMSSNVLESYLWVRLPELGPLERAREVAGVLRRLPGLVAAERRDRSDFLRQVYKRYEGADLGELDRLVDEVLTPHTLARVSAAALRRVRQHRAAGHRTVLLTGAVRPLTRPFWPLFDEVVSADLAADAAGRATGYLASPPLVGEARAAWVVRYAQVGGYDLARSYAYADSHSDLPLLRCVGLPTAVSPDVPLLRAARAARWPVETWAAPVRSGGDGGLVRRLVPSGQPDTSGMALP
jgi:phosphoserine phosphatase/nucleoside-diphosphate-sugar epimerase